MRTIFARVLTNVPVPNKHWVHFYGAYVNRVRSSYRSEGYVPPEPATDATPSRSALTKRWRELIYRVYEVDRLTCPRCDSSMKLLAFITERSAITKILDHRDKMAAEPRAPPTKPSH